MRLIRSQAVGDISMIYLLQLRDDPDCLVESVGSFDPRVPHDEKMVLVLSSQIGCPIKCTTCDAAGDFRGNLTADELLGQVRFLLETWVPKGTASRCPKFKVQFARMGEPSLNDAVVDVLEVMPDLLGLPGLMPCLATMAPRGREAWFEHLLRVRRRVWDGRPFQLQFSLQTTDDAIRDRLIPVRRWSLDEIARYAREFVRPGERRVALNFALATDVPVDPSVLAATFDPAACLVKLTPLNPTRQGASHGWKSAFERPDDAEVLALAAEIRERGFDCIVSTGLPEEARASSSCGQVALRGRPIRCEETRAAL